MTPAFNWPEPLNFKNRRERHAPCVQGHLLAIARNRHRRFDEANSSAAHDEDSSLTAFCPPDYDAIDRNVFHVTPAEDECSLSVAELDAAGKGMLALIEWLWSDGCKNSDGLQNRAVVLCSVFVPTLRGLTMTEMARGFGKKKQSIGRAVDSFKARFPHIRTANMK